MVDSPSWLEWARAGNSRAAPVRRAREHTTALDVAGFGLSVLMVVIYTQCWLMAVQGDKAGITDSPLVRAMFFPAYGAGVVLAALAPGRSLRAFARQPLLILILLIVAASALWSINPDQTLRRVVALAMTTLGGAVIAARWRWAQLAEVVGAAHALTAAASLIAVVALPRFGVMHELFPGAWRGLWTEKNSLGINMTIGFIACVAAAVLEPRRRRLWIAAAGLCLVMVLGSTSKTSLVSCLIGLAGMGLVAVVRRGPVGRLVGTWGAVTGALLLGIGLLFASDAFLAVLGKDATLTGRTRIWSAVMGRIQERPWLGYGYGAVWSDTDPWAPLAWITRQAGFRAYHAHNSWLEQWLGLGVAGLAAWSLYFAEVWTRALIALYRSAGAYLAMPFLLLYSVTTLTESVVLTFNDSRWLIFVAIAVRLAAPEAPARPENALFAKARIMA
jgi:O-antigen ligase